MDDSTAQSEDVEMLKRYKRLRKQLVSIIEEREYLINHRFYNLKTEYIQKIGYLEFELYELDIRLGQAKRRIELVQSDMDSNVPLNLSRIESEINKEFKDFLEVLELKDKEIQIANYLSTIEQLSDEEFMMLKKYYKKAAMILHPEIHSNLTELQRSLWTKANVAYENGGIVYLKIIYKLAYDEYVNMPKLEGESIEEIVSKIKYLEDKIKEKSIEIKELRESFPFNKEEMLNDNIKVREVQRELQRTIKEAKNILEIMEEHFLLLLNERQYIN